MSNALESLLPARQPGEVLDPQRLRVEGDMVYLPIHVFAGNGHATRVEASFPVAEADETIMRSAIARAVDVARAALA